MYLLKKTQTLIEKTQTLIALSIAASFSIASAASPSIGVVIAKGTLQVDASTVTSNGTLFEGTTVETGKATSELLIHGAARMYLGAESRGKVYADHLILEKGDSQMESGSTYWVQAGNLHVRATGPNSGARVSVRGANQVLVAALGGPVFVANDQGILIAKVETGRTVQLESQETGTTPASTLTGRLENVGGHYILTDETAGVKVELQGTGLEKEVGNRVEVTGSQVPSATAASGASQVIQVTSVKRVSKRRPVGTRQATGGSRGGSGMATGTKAVIAGVSVAAATGVTLALTQSEAPKQPISR